MSGRAARASKARKVEERKERHRLVRAALRHVGEAYARYVSRVNALWDEGLAALPESDGIDWTAKTTYFSLNVRVDQ